MLIVNIFDAIFLVSNKGFCSKRMQWHDDSVVGTWCAIGTLPVQNLLWDRQGLSPEQDVEKRPP